MIYFAQRAPRSYSERLSKLRSIGQPINLVSVIGGLSFLHSISSQTISLTLVDPEPDTHKYCQMILALLKNSASGQEFFEILSNRRVSNNWWLPGAFAEPIDMRPRARQYLKDAEQFALYETTYGAMRFDSSSATGWIADSQIKFFGRDLTPMTFCWDIGSGAFGCDEDFNRLKNNINRLKPRFMQERFEKLDFVDLMKDFIGDTVLLVSNVESPLFSAGDEIFRSIESKLSKPVRYLSWHRDLEIQPRQQRIERGFKDLVEALPEQNWFSLNGLDWVEGLKDLPPGNIYNNIEELRSQIHYGWGTFFINCSNLSESELEARLVELLLAIVPCFPKLVFWGKGSLGCFVSALESAQIPSSYNISKLMRYEEYYLVCCEIKGCLET